MKMRRWALVSKAAWAAESVDPGPASWKKTLFWLAESCCQSGVLTELLLES
jgi:hypothetical protein